MPSDLFAQLSDQDFAAVLAYVMSVPPVDSTWPARKLTPVGTLMFGTVGFATLPYTKIDHQASGPVAHPSEEVGPAYGRYLATIATCSDCHGGDLRGYKGPPGPPAGPDITGAGALAGWSSDDFVHMMRTGLRPDGTAVGAEMPFAGYAGMTTDELHAIYLYLKGLPTGG
jgi:mono/diheme cytochrome c family protein